MKQRKIAISLAVVGALAAPFLLGTYKMHPTYEAWVPFTADEKSSIAARLARTNNCQTLSDRIDQLGKPPNSQQLLNALVDEDACQSNLKDLKAGGMFQTVPDLGKYLLFNAVPAAAAFVSIFCLAFLVPAIVRRYWRSAVIASALRAISGGAKQINPMTTVLYFNLGGIVDLLVSRPSPEIGECRFPSSTNS